MIKHSCLLILLSSYAAATIVKPRARVGSNNLFLGSGGAAHTLDRKQIACSQTHVADKKDHDILNPDGAAAQNTLDQRSRTNCTLMCFILAGLCCLGCCSSVIQAGPGRNDPTCQLISHALSCASTIITLAMFIYLFMSGTFSAWRRGDDVGLTCQIMCWWIVLQLFFLLFYCICLCCCFPIFLVGMFYHIKNEQIKKMKEEFDAKEKDLSGPRREYYKSDVFKQKCDELFDKADVDGSGALDMGELEHVVIDMLGKDFRQAAQNDEDAEAKLHNLAWILKEAFDENRNSSVEKAEFVEMMKFVSMLQLQDGKFNVEQAFEVLQLPETATMSDVNRAYRRMAIRYHPDKRPNEDKEKVDKDMAEINDAKAVLEQHINAKALG